MKKKKQLKLTTNKIGTTMIEQQYANNFVRIVQHNAQGFTPAVYEFIYSTTQKYPMFENRTLLLLTDKGQLLGTVASNMSNPVFQQQYYWKFYVAQSGSQIYYFEQINTGSFDLGIAQLFQNFGSLYQRTKQFNDNQMPYYTGISSKKTLLTFNFFFQNLMKSTLQILADEEDHGQIVAQWDASQHLTWFMTTLKNYKHKLTHNIHQWKFYDQFATKQQMQAQLSLQKQRMMQKAVNIQRSIVPDYQKVISGQTVQSNDNNVTIASKATQFMDMMKEISGLLPQQTLQGSKDRQPLRLITRLVASLTSYYSMFQNTMLQQANLGRSTRQNKAAHAKFNASMMQFSRCITLLNLDVFRCLRTRNSIDIKKMAFDLEKTQQFVLNTCANYKIHYDYQVQTKVRKCLFAINKILQITKDRPIPRFKRPAPKNKQSPVQSSKMKAQMETISKQLVAVAKMNEQEVTVLLTMNKNAVNIHEIRVIEDITPKSGNYANSMEEQINKPGTNQLLLAIEAEKPTLNITPQQKYPTPPAVTNQILIAVLPSQIKQAQTKTDILKNSLDMSALILIEKRVRQLQLIGQRIAYYNDLIKEGKVYDPVQCYSELQVNASLVVALSQSLLFQIDICSEQLTDTPENKLRIQILRQRLRIATSPSLRFTITSNILQIHSAQSLQMGSKLKERLVVLDRKLFDQDAKTIIQIILQMEGKGFSDIKLNQIVDIIKTSKQPLQQILEKYHQKFAQHGSVLAAISQKIKQKKSRQMEDNLNQDNVNAYLLEVNVMKLKESAEQLKQNLSKSSKLGITRQIQQAIALQNTSKQPTETQVAAAAHLMSQAHKSLVGTQKTDYLLNARDGMNISYNQLNQVQNNTYLGNFSTVQGYFDYWGGLQFHQTAQLLQLGVSTNMLLQQQYNQTVQQGNQIRNMFGILYQSNQMIYNEVQEVNEKADQIKELIKQQSDRLMYEIQNLRSKKSNSKQFSIAMEKFNTFNLNQQQIIAQLSRTNKGEQRGLLNNLIGKIDQFARKSVQNQTNVLEAVMQAQKSTDRLQTMTLAGNLQLANLINVNEGTLRRMDFSLQNLLSMNEMVANNGAKIENRINQLTQMYNTSSGQQKYALMQILQGVTNNLITLSELSAKYDLADKKLQRQNNKLYKAIVQTSALTDNVIAKLSKTDENMKKYFKDIQDGLQNHADRMLGFMQQANRYNMSIHQYVSQQLVLIDANIRQSQKVQQRNIDNMFNQMNYIGNTLHLQNQQLNQNILQNRQISFDIKNVILDMFQNQERATVDIIQNLHYSLTQVNQNLRQKDLRNERTQKISADFRAQLKALLSKIDKKKNYANLDDLQLLNEATKCFAELERRNQLDTQLGRQLANLYGILGISAQQPGETKLIKLKQAANLLKSQLKQNQIKLVKEQAKSKYLQKQTEQTNENLKKLESKIETKQKYAQNLNQQLQHLNHQNGLSQGRVQGYQNNIKVLESQIRDSKESFRRQLESITTAQGKVEDVLKEGTQYRQKLLEQSQKKFGQLEKLNRQKLQKVEGMYKQLIQTEKQQRQKDKHLMFELQNKLRTTGQKLAAAQQSSKQHQKKVAQLTQFHQRLTSIQQNKQSQIGNHRKQMDKELEKMKEKLNKANLDVKQGEWQKKYISMQNQHKAQLQRQSQQYKRLKKQLADTQEAKRGAESLMRKQLSSSERAQGQISHWRDQYKDVQSRLDEIVERVTKQRMLQKRAVTEQLKQMTGKMQDSTAKAAQADAKATALAKQISGLQLRISTYQGQQRVYKQSMAQDVLKRNQLIKQLGQVKKEKILIQDQLKTTSQEFAKAKQELDKLNKLITGLLQEIKKINSENQTQKMATKKKSDEQIKALQEQKAKLIQDNVEFANSQKQKTDKLLKQIQTTKKNVTAIEGKLVHGQKMLKSMGLSHQKVASYLGKMRNKTFKLAEIQKTKNQTAQWTNAWGSSLADGGYVWFQPEVTAQIMKQLESIKKQQQRKTLQLSKLNAQIADMQKLKNELLQKQKATQQINKQISSQIKEKQSLLASITQELKDNKQRKILVQQQLVLLQGQKDKQAKKVTQLQLIIDSQKQQLLSFQSKTKQLQKMNQDLTRINAEIEQQKKALTQTNEAKQAQITQLKASLLELDELKRSKFALTNQKKNLQDKLKYSEERLRAFNQSMEKTNFTTQSIQKHNQKMIQQNNLMRQRLLLSKNIQETYAEALSILNGNIAKWHQQIQVIYDADSVPSQSDASLINMYNLEIQRTTELIRQMQAHFDTIQQNQNNKPDNTTVANSSMSRDMADFSIDQIHPNQANNFIQNLAEQFDNKNDSKGNFFQKTQSTFKTQPLQPQQVKYALGGFIGSDIGTQKTVVHFITMMIKIVQQVIEKLLHACQICQKGIQNFLAMKQGLDQWRQKIIVSFITVFLEIQIQIYSCLQDLARPFEDINVFFPQATDKQLIDSFSRIGSKFTAISDNIDMLIQQADGPTK